MASYYNNVVIKNKHSVEQISMLSCIFQLHKYEFSSFYFRKTENANNTE